VLVKAVTFTRFGEGISRLACSGQERLLTIWPQDTPSGDSVLGCRVGLKIGTRHSTENVPAFTRSTGRVPLATVSLEDSYRFTSIDVRWRGRWWCA